MIRWIPRFLRWIIGLPVRVARWFIGSVGRHAQNVSTALVQIWANKGRSVLTTLGIIIAVTSIISVVSFVQGFGDYITGMVRGYGTQFMVVRPWYPRGFFGAGIGRVTLDMADVHAVRTECDKIHRMSPFVYTHNGEIAYGKEKADDIPVRGVTEQYQTIRNFFVDAGRFFGPVDVANGANVVVLGRTVLQRLQCDDSIVGQHVFLDNERFLVVGLLEKKGSLFGEDQDETVMIPYTTALNLYPERRDMVFFLAEAASEAEIPAASAQIARVLRRRHGLQPGQPDDFRIDRQDQALNDFEQVRDVARGILAGIVSISLLVGGIGIMNVMLVSVTERTREIGLRKSVGGRRRDIMLQFLTEAVVLCTLGGVIGLVFGYAITYVASLHPRMVEITVPLWAVALALGFSAGAGIIFGIVPAFKAAILHPIDALRHE
jgi:putative ABC transport system permease protein